MPKNNVQFHANPTETISLIKDFAKEYNLHIVIIELYPSFIVNLLNDVGDIENVSICLTNRFCLYINKPDTTANSYLDFLDRNPDCLSVTVGKFTDNQLEESLLATQTEDSEYLKIWKKVLKKFTSVTLSGAWVVNPNNGTKVFYKQHRYTEGAKKLFDDGVKIIPVAGWNYYILSSGLIV